VSRRCRHLGADLANGTLDEEGHLVCPWHRSAYDVHTGRMVRGPQGVFAKVPGLDAAYRALSRVLPLMTLVSCCGFCRRRSAWRSLPVSRMARRLCVC
jgi:phenylpropionate dioxygenase-like ring-hydroxylating dioxygenase large terminal subunit